jgi:hypothetical protein
LTKTSSAYRRLSKWYAQELLDATLVVEYTMHGAVGDMDRSMSNSAYGPKQRQASHVEREHGTDCSSEIYVSRKDVKEIQQA